MSHFPDRRRRHRREYKFPHKTNYNAFKRLRPRGEKETRRSCVVTAVIREPSRVVVVVVALGVANKPPGEL